VTTAAAGGPGVAVLPSSSSMDRSSSASMPGRPLLKDSAALAGGAGSLATGLEAGR
jgi:hypothetical protein